MKIAARLRRPATSVVVGVVSLAAGLIGGRIPYAVPGGFRWSADQTYTLCHQVASITGQGVPGTPTCQHAEALMAVCGILILAGLALLVTGLVRAYQARQRRAAVRRHPAARTAL